MHSFVILSDMHWGRSKTPEEFYKEMKSSVIDVIKEYAVIDAIVITGDYWDRVLSMQHQSATYGILFMRELFHIAMDKNSKIRVVLGTKSHDNDMLEWFTIMARTYSDRLDLEVINTIKEEELFEDMRVLYVPEEYIKSYDDHFSPFFIKDRYDMVFGHGLIDKASFVAATQESEITSPSAPIIKSDDLLMICRGPIFFGHIHTPMVIKKRIYYVGSTSRFSHGEEGDKGFYHVLYSKDNYKATFIKNSKAPIYDTLTYKVTKDTKYEELLSSIDNDIMRYTIFAQLRIKIAIDDNVEPDKSFILTLQQRYGSSKYFKLVIENSNKIKQQMEKDKAVKKILEEHDYLFDKNMEDHDRISKYISKTKLKELSPERVKQILYEKYLT